MFWYNCENCGEGFNMKNELTSHNYNHKNKTVGESKVIKDQLTGINYEKCDNIIFIIII